MIRTDPRAAYILVEAKSHCCAAKLDCELMDLEHIPNLYVGTSSWSAESWVGPFYPPGTPPADFLPIYATHYRTVEIDATYYRIPSRKMVQGWRDRTPPGFTFAAKFPGEITHKKLLIDCERETQTWVHYVRQFLHRGEVVYAYYNNHYAGWAPGSVVPVSKALESPGLKLESGRPTQATSRDHDTASFFRIAV